MSEASDFPDGDIRRLLAIMARLRDPAAGCPWDLAQTFETIAPHTIEEAYEVVDAIRLGEPAAVKDELGDLLFQVVFYAQLAEEKTEFSFHDVVAAICDKMLRRHPHIFGTASIDGAAAQTVAWETQKAAEREAQATVAGGPLSALDGVTVALPGLTRAIKLQNRAARVGFDWPDIGPVFAKLAEELRELDDELKPPVQPAAVEEEFGDVLFVVANLARHLKIDPEAALRKANSKFERRFRRIEALLAADGRSPESSDLAEMDLLWDRAKAEERG